MLAVRQKPLSPGVEYFLDAAEECTELDACSAMVLRLYGDEASLRPICTSGYTNYRDRQQKCLGLSVLADGILPQLPSDRRAGLVHLGLRYIIIQTIEIAKLCAQWAMEDSIEGGCLEPFRYRVRARNGITFKRTDRRLQSPKFIRRYARRIVPYEFSHLRSLAAIALRRSKEFRAAPDRTILADHRKLLSYRIHQNEKGNRKTLRADRKMIRRSLQTATNIVGENTVRAFLRGEEIKLIGHESMLVLRKQGKLTDYGCGCLSIGLADRNGTRLADLCTYIENTPTLDQLAGFALWMNVGEDRKVLQTANIISVAEPKNADHPLLKLMDHGPARERALTDLIQAIGEDRTRNILAIITQKRRPFTGRQLTFEQQRERNGTYWNETKDHWIEAILTHVIGCRHFPILREVGVL